MYKPVKKFLQWPYYVELNGLPSAQVESLYQAFKERLMQELVAGIEGGRYGYTDDNGESVILFQTKLPLLDKEQS